MILADISCQTGYRCEVTLIPQASNGGVSQNGMDVWPWAVMVVALCLMAVLMFWIYWRANKR